MQEPTTGQLTRRVHVHCYSEVNRRYNVTFGELNLKYLLIVQIRAMIQLHVHSLHFKIEPKCDIFFLLSQGTHSRAHSDPDSVRVEGSQGRV